MTATVAVVGGGYAGITVAKALDDVAHVALIDPQEVFIHNVMALRAVVQPSVADRMFLEYSGLLENGSHVQDLALQIDSRGVVLRGGGRVDADFVVLTSGTSYPFPAKLNNISASAGIARVHRTAQQIRKANRVLIVGAGPVGLELAGEIRAVSPHKEITIVEINDDIVSGPFPQELRDSLREQLHNLRIRLLLGTSLAEEVPIPSGRTGSFTVATRAGDIIGADIWFRCYGRVPTSGYLKQTAAIRRMDGRVRVDSMLRVVGARNMFAAGDVADVPEPDTAIGAQSQAEAVAHNIRALIEGGQMKEYEVPEVGTIFLPLGPKLGASYVPGMGLVDAAQTSEMKGIDMFLSKFEEILNIKQP